MIDAANLRERSERAYHSRCKYRAEELLQDIEVHLLKVANEGTRSTHAIITQDTCPELTEKSVVKELLSKLQLKGFKAELVQNRRNAYNQTIIDLHITW